MSRVRAWIDELRQDVPYAVRTLRRSPGFTLVAVLTLGLGIGATTAIASLVDTILLQPLPFTDSERLVRLVEYMPHVVPGRAPLQRGVTYDEFLEWRTRTTTLDEVAAVAGGQRIVRTDTGMARLWGTGTTPGLFAMLGTRAMLGRTLTAGDERNPNQVLLSHDTWRRLLRSDPEIVGKALEFRSILRPDARMMTVVGVLPPEFELPLRGPHDYFTPFDLSATRPGNVTLLARMREGVSVDAANAEANVIGNAICPPRRANAPALPGPRFEVQRVKDQIVGDLRPALGVLFAAVAVVLTIVCANVANLLLARGTSRAREIAVRLAIGASRGRVARQVLAECTVLAIAGGAAGALLAAGGLMLVRQLTSVEVPGIFRLVFGPSILPRGGEVGVDFKMFAIAFGLAAATSVIFGVLPALHLSRTIPMDAMGSRSAGAGRRESHVRGALAVGQVVMATVLLVGAGLLAYSFVKLTRVDRGYNPSHSLAFQLVFPNDHSIARKTETIDALLDRLRAAPNVESAGFTRAGILIPEEIFIGTFVPRGRTLEEMRADSAKPRVRPVSPGYLSAIGARFLAGRELEASDATAAAPAIVITRGVAQRYFESRDGVGQLVDWHVNDKLVVQAQVVGVVQDVRNESPQRDPFPEIFVDYRRALTLLQQSGMTPVMQDQTAIGLLSFAVRTRDDPSTAIPAVEQIVRAVDRNAGIDALLPMERLVASSVARQRFYAVLLATFAGVAGFLAAIGIYGVLAYGVVQRTREIGIRMALGAQRAQVLSLVLRRGLILTSIGIALGLAGAAASARVLEGMLFGITPLDPRTFTAVAVLFGIVAAFASYVPARRATKVDPMVALRHDA